MITQIVEKGKHLKIDEKRSLRDDYAEFVIFAQELVEWDKILGEFLGPVKKPAGKKPTPDEQTVTDPYGGIQRDQILYQGSEGEALLLAMLWPWRDQVHITVKIARVVQKPR